MLPAVTVPGPALRDGFSHVLGLTHSVRELFARATLQFLQLSCECVFRLLSTTYTADSSAVGSRCTDSRASGGKLKLRMWSQTRVLVDENGTEYSGNRSVDASSFAEIFAGSCYPKVKVTPWSSLGCCCCVSGLGASVVVVRFWLLWLCFLLTQETTKISSRLDGPAHRHRSENRNFFRYPQRPRRTSTAKCSLKVFSSPVPVHRDGAGHRENGCLLRDGCCGWCPPGSGAA